MTLEWALPAEGRGREFEIRGVRHKYFNHSAIIPGWRYICVVPAHLFVGKTRIAQASA
jgi:hypothetical protein